MGLGDCFLSASNLGAFNWLLLQLPSDLLSQMTTAPETEKLPSGSWRASRFPPLIYVVGSIVGPEGGEILPQPLTYWDFHAILL